MNSLIAYNECDVPDLSIPYYIIDFNSNECMLFNGLVMRYNNYPHIVMKNAYLENGLELPDDAQEAFNGFETLFNQVFTEITKEEYLEIHNQCIAGTWVPEWE